mgnify:CR=1 FL=1
MRSIPELAVGYARLGQYYWDIGDRESGYRTLDRAIALDPNDLLVLTFLAGIAMRNGEVAGAIGRYDGIVARDPRSAAHHANRGIFLQAAGRLDEAKSELETAKEFSPDLAPEIDLTIARILIVQKRFDQASALINGLPEGDRGRDHGLARSCITHRGATWKRTRRSIASLRGRLRRSTSASPRSTHFAGMNDQAFETLQGLQDAVDRNAPSEASQLWTWQVELRVSPFMAPLHDDPRWQKLLVEPRCCQFLTGVHRAERRVLRSPVVSPSYDIGLRRRQSVRLRIERAQVQHHERLAALLRHGAEITAAAAAEDEVRGLLSEAVARRAMPVPRARSDISPAGSEV